MRSVFLPATHGKKTENPNQKRLCSFQNSPLIPSFLPSFPPFSSNVPPSFCPFQPPLKQRFFQEALSSCISIKPHGKDVCSWVFLVTGLISLWWSEIYRPGSISGAKTVTQSSSDPSYFFSITANLLLSPRGKESS